MKKLILGLLTFCTLASNNSNAQNSIWAMPNNNGTQGYVDMQTNQSLAFPTTDFSGTPYNNPNIGYSPSISNWTHVHKGAANAIRSANGSLLFFIIGNSIFDYAGRTIYTNEESYEVSSGISEIAVVPDPGNCNRYYLFTDKGEIDQENVYYSTPVYTILDVSQTNNTNFFNTSAQGNLVNMDGTNANGFSDLLLELGVPNTDIPKNNYVNFAIGKLKNNLRTVILRTKNGFGVNNHNASTIHFKLASNGFTNVNWTDFLATLPTSSYFNNIHLITAQQQEVYSSTCTRSELEIFENLDGTTSISYPTKTGLVYFKLDANLNYIQSSFKTIRATLGTGPIFISGYEFSNNGRYIYFSHEANSLLPNAIDCWDIQANTFVTLPQWANNVPNDHRYSYIESYNNRLYLARETWMSEISNIDNPTSSSFNPTFQKVNYKENFWEKTAALYFSNIPSIYYGDFKRFPLPDQIDGEDYSAFGEVQITLSSFMVGCNGSFDPICVTSGSPSYSYEWFDLAGNLLSTSTCFTPSAETNYYLFVTNPLGCDRKYKIKVSSTPKPNISALKNVTYCSLDNKHLNNIGWTSNPIPNHFTEPVTYTWSYNGNILPNNSYSCSFYGDGNYSVEINSNCHHWIFHFTVTDELIEHINHPFALPNVSHSTSQGLINFQFTANSTSSLLNYEWTVTEDGVQLPIGYNYFYNVNNYVQNSGVPIEAKLKITDLNNCTIWSNSLFIGSNKKKRNTEVTIGVKNKNLFNIYPNPSNSISNIIIEGFDNEKVYSADILDLTGKLIESIQITDSRHQLNISNYKTGVYILQISDGLSITQKKLVKID